SQFPFSVDNLYVSSSDIPAIHDIDDDGDLDVLTFSLGGSHLEYHKNLSQETYGHSDSLIFELRNRCWGLFAEDPNNNSIVLNDPNAPCGNGNVSNPEGDSDPVKPKLHSGSTLLAIDFNNNGVKDLILGDVSSDGLIKLLNSGTSPNTNSPMSSVESNFPSNTTPAKLQIFPAGFYLDVDFDGVKDLLVGTNAKNASENEKSVLFYKNTGQNNQPNFIFQQKDFLQSEMIEHGTGSIPLFFDQNNDGKKDLVVANFFRYKPILEKESSIAIYRNTSAGLNTDFTFIDDDYLNLTQLNLGLRSVPSFGDLDGDGDDDLIIARENGNYMYFQNIGTTGNAVFATPVEPMTSATGATIHEETISFPQLFDLDNDGLLDLIIGKRSGELIFYKNTGTASNFEFTKVNDHLGNVDVSSASSPDGYAAPHFFRYNNETHLFLGAYDGKLHYYQNIDGKLAVDSSFTFYSNNFLNIDANGYSSFYVNDIDNDGYLNLFVGTDLGGILHLEIDPNSTSGIQERVKNELLIYPNPSKGNFSIHQNSTPIQSIAIYNSIGQKVDFRWTNTNSSSTIELNDVENGVYLVKVVFEDNSIGQKRIVVMN
ncbi:MAG: T9SS type A sorting domain-containing protein, partial [Bacteroidota bacterium]